MKRRLILAVVVLVGILFTFRGSALQGLEPDQVCGGDSLMDSNLLNSNPELLFSANNHLNESNFVDILKTIDYKLLQQEEGKLNSAKLMTFGEYAKIVGWDNRPQLRMSSERMVWYVEFYYPSMDHPRLGSISDVTVISLYDAETGEHLGCSYYGDLGQYRLE
jgi:hypothetical protein